MATPLCPYFGQCGGCTSQHIDYSLQLQNKRDVLSRAIGRDEIEVFSGSDYFYRNRMDMIFHPTGIGQREKGKWWKVVDLDRCAISNERLNELMKEVRDFFQEVDAFDMKKHAGTFRYAVIRTPQNDSSISFVLNRDSTRISEAIDLIKKFVQLTTANHIVVTYVPSNTDVSTATDYVVLKGSDTLRETILGKIFSYSIQGFFQNNSKMAEVMHQYVRSRLESYDRTYAHLLDLYGGVGTFGIVNADLFKAVTTVESFQGCTDSANENIKLNGTLNVTAVCKDAMHLKGLSFPQPLFVITDPPRSGMHPKTIEALLGMKPKVIIYVSCNVSQLAADMPKFLRHYNLRRAALFDFFPQTNHSESVVELILKN